MKHARFLAPLLLASLPLVAACGQDNNPAHVAAESTRQATTELRDKMTEVRDKVHSEIQSGDIKLDAKGGGAPDARITPAGDFYVGDRKVDVNDEQRALLLQYRANVAEVAAAGAEIGMQGAELATHAVGEAIKGIFSGNPDDIEARIEAEADKIKVSARKLCDHLPPMMETQNALAAALPEFKPYADMDQGDIDDCMDETVAEETGHGDAPASKNPAEEAEAASTP